MISTLSIEFDNEKSALYWKWFIEQNAKGVIDEAIITTR